MDTAIKQAVDKMDYLSSDEDAVRRYQQREMALYDYMCGIQKAKKERDIEVAKNLLKAGVSIELVEKGTELDMAIIKKLKAELDNE